MTRIVQRVAEVLAEPTEIPCLIEGMIPERSLVAVVSAPSAGKSLLTWDMVAHIALGMPWQGRLVQQVPALIIAGEGASGLPGRIHAWCEAHDVDPEDFDGRLALLRVPLDLSDEEMVARVEQELAELDLAPKLLVFDTWSACAPFGFDESSTRDAKGLMDLMRQTRDRLQATLMLVHHVGHNGERERGSSDFRAAVDVLFLLKNDEGLRTLSMSKARDLPPIPPIRFRVRGMGQSVGLEYLVGDQPEPMPEALGPSHVQLLAVLAECGLGDAMRARDLMHRSGHPQSTFYRLAADLQRSGHIGKDRRGYVLTRAGEDLVRGHSHGTPTTLPRDSHTPTTLKGGSVGVSSKSSQHSQHSHGTPMGVPRECGPGALPFPWHALEGAE